MEDMLWVLNGGPWTFDSDMLLVDVITMGIEPLKVQLWSLNIWIQIHDLPSGFMTEAVEKQLGNFFGEFRLYDGKIILVYGVSVCVLRSELTSESL